MRVPRPAEERPLELCEEPLPAPGPGELRVRVEVCGVCRTDLHVAEGDLAPQRPSVVPGHEVVGRVDAVGPGVAGPREGDRVGVAWLQRSCGACRFCARGAENLCLAPRFTGWHADGGYAEHCVAPAEFVYPLPEDADAQLHVVLEQIIDGVAEMKAGRDKGAVKIVQALDMYGKYFNHTGWKPLPH